jgi:Methyltransferase domain
VHPKTALKRLWYRVFRDHPYLYLGRLVLPLCSRAYLRRVQDDFLVHPQLQSLVRRIVEAGLSARYFAQDDAAIARANRASFWGGTAGRRWHQMKAEGLSDPQRLRWEFEEFRAPILRHLRSLAGSGAYTTVCEIGTGNGLFLEYLSRFPGLDSLRFVGIDLNREQIANNQAVLANDRLSFECVEAVEWIQRNRPEGTIFLTHDALHHFTSTELRRMLEAIARLKGAALVASEPVDRGLPADVLSKPRGGIGITFSHNYTAYLRDLGYTIVAVHETSAHPQLPVYDHRLVVARPALPSDAAVPAALRS